MRLCPPTGIVSRCAEQEDTIGGFHIPAGSIVLIRPFAILDEPKHVRPGSFQESQRRLTSAYLRFGGGPRQCIGNTFALMELALVVTTITKRCQLDFEPEDEMVTTLLAAKPFRIPVTPRAPALV